eukprot:14258841-Heterocapsa_arctica.AAC.1
MIGTADCERASGWLGRAPAQGSGAMEGLAPAGLDAGRPVPGEPEAPADQVAALDLPRSALVIATWNAAAVFSSVHSSQVR